MQITFLPNKSVSYQQFSLKHDIPNKNHAISKFKMSHLSHLPMLCTKNNDLKVYKQQGPQQNPPVVQGHIHCPLPLLLAATTLTFITQLMNARKSVWGKLIVYRCTETETAASSALSHIQCSRKAVWRIIQI